MPSISRAAAATTATAIAPTATAPTADAAAADAAITAAGVRARRTTDDPRWARVLARDPEADGSFFYSVKTTGVYCRPSCASRAARPENVAFHASTDAAERAGFRPCRRCRPNDADARALLAAKIADLCRYLEHAPQVPSLEALGRRASTSPWHLQRTFKAVTGLTPRQYANAHRAKRAREAIAAAPTVTDAIYAAGFNSSGRFYEQADAMLGMTPTRVRAGGAGMDIHVAIGECSLGAILVARSARGVCAILLGDDPAGLLRDLQDRFPNATLNGADAGFDALVATVVGLVEAPRAGVDLPLDVRGTAFQQRVWRALQQIAPGSTCSYAELARRIGQPSAVRAVAQACAANAHAVAIPCHRVVRTDGSLSGYRWGVARKRALLEREAKA
ncbi:MAG: bifunctional DNA-binding transcriptional regulator/O6-methylguanine-DNA methyltransferase Ada [Lautropia sp.]